MTTAFLSIGSNIDRRRNVSAALERLAELFGPLRISSVYECPAVGFEGGDFYNLAVAFDTELPPTVLVGQLKRLEHGLGRRRTGEKFSDRPIDIDLVMYGTHSGRFDDLTLPRRDVLRRAFILRPLAEIEPALVHPQAGRTLAELWRQLAEVDDGALRKVEL